jgi:hypothetical protein
VGRERILRTEGARETLEPLSCDFLLRFVPHLEVTQLETLIRSANGQDPYAPQIDAALASLSKRPEAMDRLVDAAVRGADADGLSGGGSERGKEAEWHRDRGEVNSLKLQVAQCKGSNGAPEVIRGLERRIEGLEKTLRDER